VSSAHEHDMVRPFLLQLCNIKKSGSYFAVVGSGVCHNEKGLLAIQPF